MIERDLNTPSLNICVSISSLLSHGVWAHVHCPDSAIIIIIMCVIIICVGNYSDQLRFHVYDHCSLLPSTFVN